MYDPLTTKPRGFRAVCRKGAWLPLDQLTPAEVADVERREQERKDRNEYHSLFRYDSKLKAEVAHVACTLDTTDRDEFLEHVGRVHGEKPRNVIWQEHSTQSLSNRARGKWRTPKAPPEGTPVRWSTAGLAATVVTCPDCGLVMETGSRLADELFIREHLELCARAGAA